jgi:phenylacetate-CoA ligase
LVFYRNKIKALSFFLKVNFFRRRALRLFESLVSEGKLSRIEREKLATERISAILQHAYENTEFYRRHYDSHQFDVYSFKNLDDMRRIPIVRKEDLATHSSEFRDTKCKENVFRRSTTGGSSGKVTTVYHDARVQLEGLQWYLLSLWGVHPSSNAAFLERYIPGAKDINNPGEIGWIKNLVNKLIWWPTQRVHLNITNVSDLHFRSFYKKCLKIQPVYIEGYVGAIQEFSEFLMANKLKLPSIKFVWTTSAPLTNNTRKLILDVFDCPVYDQYGCCEIYWLGAEVCNRGGLHTFDTLRHMEIINEDDEYCEVDEYGAILLTDMLNYAFPLIRYANGDRGAFAPDCTCQVTNFRRIRSVKGRLSENIKLPKGGFIAGEFLTTIFDGYPNAVSQFQLIQDRDYKVSVNYVAQCGELAETELGLFKENISKIFKKAGLLFQFNSVETIGHDNGKLRFVICNVNEVPSSE